MTRGKNLWRNDYSQFDNKGGVGSTYIYFYVGADHVISCAAKNDITIPDNHQLGITHNGGNNIGSYYWLLNPGMIIKRDRHYQ